MSNRCDKAYARLYVYMDGEMGWYSRVRVSWHLHRCAPCSDSLEFERKLKQRVRDGCAEEIPSDLCDRLRTFLRQHGVEGPGAD
jgi:mycothiol system anti-sigma-R factor